MSNKIKEATNKMYGGLTRDEMCRRIVADIQPCDLSLIEKFPRKWNGLDVFIRKDNQECIALVLSGTEVWEIISGKKIDPANNPFFERNMYDYYYDKKTGTPLGKVEYVVPDEYFSGGSKHEDLEIALWWFIGLPEDVPIEQDDVKPEPMPEPVKVVESPPTVAPASCGDSSWNWVGLAMLGT
jgi:hypothetical protein